MKARVSDIFISIQGEGKYLGEEQCFLRFYYCDYGCDFCDTKLHTYQEYSVDDLITTMKQVIGERSIKTVSITGGEPLLQRDFLLEFLPRLKREGFQSYLETNGVLFSELFDVIDHVDIIAMDIKLPSSTKQKAFWHEHEEFLKVATRKDVFVKTVICQDTYFDDVEKAVRLVTAIDPHITFIIQPNSAQLGRVLAEKLRDYKTFCRKYLLDVRVIPQLHKAIGMP